MLSVNYYYIFKLFVSLYYGEGDRVRSAANMIEKQKIF